MADAKATGRFLRDPGLMDKILANPVFRAALGAADPYLAASRAVGDITNPLAAAGDMAAHMTGNDAITNLNSAIDNARLATGRTNPHSPGLATPYFRNSSTNSSLTHENVGNDYYRLLGSIIGGIGGAEVAGIPAGAQATVGVAAPAALGPGTAVQRMLMGSRERSK